MIYIFRIGLQDTFYQKGHIYEPIPTSNQSEN